MLYFKNYSRYLTSTVTTAKNQAKVYFNKLTTTTTTYKKKKKLTTTTKTLTTQISRLNFTVIVTAQPILIYIFALLG
uniref:Uncharacterized protein n=1 Tax=Brassica oleracea var. oleracea TaxID=109376 RepID=A0A0D3BET8_BRAOL